MSSLVQYDAFDQVFDAEATRNICLAFDKACARLREQCQPEYIKDLIARRVIALARRGERDPERLSEATLSSLGLKQT
jgi:hypothetical protein